MEDRSEPARILAVDDSVVNLRLLEAILGEAGFEVITTSRGPDALDLALKVHPDLVLLDVMMPGLGGLEVLGQLKAHSETQDLPVLMVTARTQGEDVRDALEAGAHDYLKKPLDGVETIARIRAALRFHENQSRLLEMATHDSLTGLYNHKLLLELLGRELSDARRKGVPVSYCMIDIDHFRQYNAEHGHQAGDQVLREVSRLLAQGVRRSDVVGRYGGEEFGIVLGSCDLTSAQILCDRLRGAVASQGVSVSMGLACAAPGETITEEELVRKADLALYEAKNGGRNRLVTA